MSLVKLNGDYGKRFNRGEVSAVVRREEEVKKIAWDLRKYHGTRFIGSIRGIELEGKICVEGDRVFLCQNEHDGLGSRNKLGYPYSWCVQGREIDVPCGECIITRIINNKYKLAFRHGNKRISAR